jgi:hypothetical protein
MPPTEDDTALERALTGKLFHISALPDVYPH